MAATIMRSINAIYSQIIQDFPALTFVHADDFYWRSESSTIHHPAVTTMEDLYLLLHEIGHAVSGHAQFTSDLGLLDMEREAWTYALSTLVPTYQLDAVHAIEISENAMDSYRDWLHNRSTCPGCTATGIATAKNSYRCLVCHQEWRVNEARTCELRRYKK